MTSSKFNNEIEDILKKYPDKIPIIITNKDESSNWKFLINSDVSLAQFMNMFRKRVDLSKEESIYFAIKYDNKHTFEPTSSYLGDLHNKYKENDNILKLYFFQDNVFGL